MKPNGYDLCLMLAETNPKPGKLYLREVGKKIAYTVITPEGKIVVDVSTNIQAPKSFTLDTLAPLKKMIFKTTLKKGHTLPNYATESELLTAYKVFLGLINDLIKGFQYFSEMKNIKNNSKIYNMAQNFWADMSMYSFYRALNILILLYDRDNQSLTLESFLKQLKMKVSISSGKQLILSQVQAYLNDLRNPPFDSLIKALIFLRVKKYFHLDFDNVTGRLHVNLLLSSNMKKLEFEDILLMKDKAVDIIKYSASFFNIDSDKYIGMSNDFQNLIDNLSILNSQEKLQNRIVKIKNQEDIKIAREKYIINDF